MSYEIVLTPAAIALATAISTPTAVEQQVRKEIDEIMPDLPNEDINRLMFHTVFIGGDSFDGTAFLCAPHRGKLIVDTCTMEDMGPIERADGLFKGRRAEMPVPQTESPGYARDIHAASVQYVSLREAFRKQHGRDTILTDEEIFAAGEEDGSSHTMEWLSAMTHADDAKRELARIGSKS